MGIGKTGAIAFLIQRVVEYRHPPARVPGPAHAPNQLLGLARKHATGNDFKSGSSSFDVIRHLRKQLGIKKMGHAGTLDPLATGLMIIGVGAGTKKLKDLIGLDKTYEAEILLGESTTTGDAEGAVTATTTVRPLDNGTIKSAVEGLRGVLNLPVPAYCAIKVGGQRLYKLARQGKPVTLPVKTMKVLDIKMRNHRPTADGLCIVSIEMSVSSGTYVR